MPIERTPQNQDRSVGRTPKSVSFARTLDFSDSIDTSYDRCRRLEPGVTPFVPPKHRRQRITDEGRDDLACEARDLLRLIEKELDEARNLKTSIKDNIKKFVKDVEDKIHDLAEYVEPQNITPGYHPSIRTQTSPVPPPPPNNMQQMEAAIERMTMMLERNTSSIKEIQNSLNHPKQPTYAEVTTGGNDSKRGSHATLHSVAVSSEGLETGEEILDRVREAVAEGGEWIRVEKIRKAKDRRVIVSCGTKEERMKLKERIEKRKELQVEVIQNKDPLLIFRNILKKNTNEEIIDQIRKQNRKTFEGVREEDNRMEVKFRKPAKNQLLTHAVMTVSPIIWGRMVTAGSQHISMQRIYVEDYSPLMQCSVCLSYGHVKRFCQKKAEKCCHCGGEHKKADCASWLAGALPTCLNCIAEDNEVRHHNAFSNACQVRQRWDALARSRVAYS